MRLCGKCKSEIDKYPLDFYSVGHVVFGYVTYILVFFIGMLIENLYIRNGALMHTLGITILVGLLWELVENNLIVKKKSFKKCQDSLNNSLCDILCVAIGGIIAGFLIFHFIDDLFTLFILNILILLGMFLVFYITGTITFNK